MIRMYLLQKSQRAQLYSSQCILIQQLDNSFSAIIEFVAETSINDEAGVEAFGLDLYHLGLAPAPPLLGAGEGAH